MWKYGESSSNLKFNIKYLHSQINILYQRWSWFVSYKNVSSTIMSVYTDFVNR